MVVPAVPNLARLHGRVTGRRPHPRLDDWDVVTVAAESVEPVPGLADLVSPRLAAAAAPPGGSGPPEVEVAVRRALLGSAGPGAALDCRVKATPAGLQAEKTPRPGDFAVSPG